MSARIENVWDIDQYNELIKKDCPVVVKFFADWCGACQVTTTQFGNISRNPDFSHITFASVNVDKNSEISDKEDVRSVPTFLLYNKGRKRGRIVGVEDPEKFEEYMTKKIKSKLPKKQILPETETFWNKAKDLFDRTINRLWSFTEYTLGKIKGLFWR